LGFYKQGAKDYGILGRMKFAMLRKRSSEQAAKQADSPGNIELFERSLTQLRLEMKKLSDVLVAARLSSRERRDMLTPRTGHDEGD
jgi:hypothetical protein